MEQSIMSLVHLKGPSLVFLVADLQASVHFYENIGFTLENIGGHIHMNYGDVTFILHEAKLKSDIRPNSSVEGGLYFDAFCYTNSEELRQLHQLFISKNVEVVKGPHWSDGWSELTIVDNNGYRIAFGG